MSDLDRYMDDFGERLGCARRPRRRRPFVLGGVLGIATAVVVALLLVLPAGESRPGAPVDAVAAMRRALDPDGVILHFRIRTKVPGNVFYEETWSTQEPQRWRLQSWPTRGPRHHRVRQYAYGGGEFRSYDGRTLRIVAGVRDDTPQSRLPTLFGRNDPDTDLQAQLTSGKLTDAGERRADGRVVRRLTRDDGVRRLVVDVDPVSFVPLGGTMTLRPPGKALSAGMTARFTVEVFERVPLSPESANLLAIDAPRPARTVRARISSG